MRVWLSRAALDYVKKDPTCVARLLHMLLIFAATVPIAAIDATEIRTAIRAYSIRS